MSDSPLLGHDVESVSYAVRHEPSYKVWLNRIGVTGSLFSVAMGLSVLLGRSRR